MVQEFYTVTLNSNNATNVVQNGGVYDCTYTINWDAIIPQKYKNNLFQLQFTFHASNSSAASNSLTIFTENLNIMNRDQGQQTILGCVFPDTSISAALQVLHTSVDDNIPIVCGYPRNTQIRVFFKLILDNSNPAFLVNYVLSLKFTPIL